MDCPTQIDGARVLEYAVLDQSIRPTFACRHLRVDLLAPSPHALTICQFQGTDHCYLFTVDEQWRCLTDSRHPSVTDAKKQADYEYAGVEGHWRFVRAEL